MQPVTRHRIATRRPAFWFELQYEAWYRPEALWATPGADLAFEIQKGIANGSIG